MKFKFIMKGKRMLLRIKIIIVVTGLLCNIYLCKSQNFKPNYTVNSIDSVSLSYYYLISISPIDSIDVCYNLLSKKGHDTIVSNNEIIIGKKYYFNLKPMYDIVEKIDEIDSVYFSPALMKTVIINGILLFNENFSIKPYETNELRGLKYIGPTLRND